MKKNAIFLLTAVLVMLLPVQLLADGPGGMVWVYINDSGIFGGFNGYMSKYETTNAQYCQFLNAALASSDITVGEDNKVRGANGSNGGADFVSMIYFNTYAAASDSQITYSGGIFSVRSRDGYDMSNHPVVRMSWYGATAFCNYYGYRLPTRWEWRAVADYDGSYTYGCGTTIDHSKANYYRDNPLGLSSPPYTSPVNHYSSYGYGMNDMAGNVSEWIDSWFSSSHSYRLALGGSWSYSAYICTVSQLGRNYPYYPSATIGFRVVKDSAPPPQEVTIRGTVSDKATDDPIVGADVGVGTTHVLTDSNGKYEITGLSPGEITVTASKDGYEDQSRTGNTVAGQTYEVNFDLNSIQTVTIRGTVYDAASSGRLDGTTITAGGQQTMTNYIGNYEITGLSAGNITVTASKDGYEEQSILQPAAQAEQTYTIDFELRPIIELVGLEVIQTIQDWNNSVPLIAGKKTWVRAHVKTKGLPYVEIPKAFLHAYREDGAKLERHLIVNNDPNFPVSPDIQREEFSKSLNFEMPPDWYKTGTLNLQLSLFNCALGCQNATSTTVNCTAKVDFIQGGILDVKFVSVNWNDGKGQFYSFGTENLLEMGAQIVSVYPIASLNSSEAPPLEWLETYRPDQDWINKQLESRRTYDSLPYLYYGAIPGPGRGGLANSIPGTVACGSSTSNTPAHELGHILGRYHAVHSSLTPPDIADERLKLGPCGEDSYAKAPDFPYIYNIEGCLKATIGPMNLGQNQNHFIYGLDSYNMQVLGPYENFELMSYCHIGCSKGARWISEDTYTALLEGIKNKHLNSTRPMMASTGPLQDYMVIHGMVNFTENTITLLPFGRIHRSVAPHLPPDGEYNLQLMNNQGNLLVEIAFQPNVHVADSSVGYGETGSFIIPVPADPNIKQVAVYHNGALLAFRSASTNPPTVQVLSPNGGDTFGGEQVELLWTASDPDGDELTYVVQYSSDAGSTWETLAVDWPELSYTIDRKYLAGTSNGLIRVMASDGFNTASDESDGVFTVLNNAPYVIIVSPKEYSVFTGEQLIFFEATSLDRKDGQLSGTSLEWSSSIDGTFGIDKTVVHDANDLSEGYHTITVTATDSGGLTDTDSVNIWVFQERPSNVAPIAVAGPNQITYARIDGFADVNLDGSNSIDVDGDELSYWWSWEIDNETYNTSGVSPTIELPVGAHTIKLIVNDGTLDSKADEVVITVMWLPATLKSSAINVLEGVKSGGKTGKELDKAIKHIQQSLEKSFKDPGKHGKKHNLWIDDSHLEPKHGKKVFDEEKEAIKVLMDIIKKKGKRGKGKKGGKDISAEIKAACQAAIDKLIEADDILASIVYDEALAGEGDPKVDKELEKCDDEFDKADKELAKEKYDKAIDHYKHAWDHAQKAIKHANK